MSIEVTYVCGQTGKTVVSSKGLPEGWVVPTMDMSAGADEVNEKTRKPPPHYTVVAFSSEEAMRQCVNKRLNRFK